MRERTKESKEVEGEVRERDKRGGGRSDEKGEERSCICHAGTFTSP